MFDNIEWPEIIVLSAGISLLIFIVNHYYKKSRWAIFAVAFPALIFIKLSAELLERELSRIDSIIYDFISLFISPGMTILMKVFTFMGSAPALIFFSLCLGLFLWVRKAPRFWGWMVVLNLTVTSLLDEVFKLIFQRPRPDILRLVPISGYSFPSGHSMTSISFYGLIIYLCIKYIRPPQKYFISGLLIVLVLAIGVSRIYLGVHYASDVIAGFSAGTAWLAIFIAISKRVRPSVLC